MTTINQEAPTFAGAPSISSLNDGIDATPCIVRLGVIPYEDALIAYQCASVNERLASSVPFAKVTSACRSLILSGWKPSQLRDQMNAIALEVLEVKMVASLCVEVGLCNGENALYNRRGQ